MKNKNFSCFEYEANERERLENLYSGTFPETDAKMSGKDLQENSSERIVVTVYDSEKGVALGETPFGQTIIIDTKNTMLVAWPLNCPINKLIPKPKIISVSPVFPIGIFTMVSPFELTSSLPPL
jgi:hypothetical protein